MKLGVSSYSFSKYIQKNHASYIDVCDHVKRIGFDGIEFINLSLDVQKADSLCALAKEIKAHCDEIGLAVAAYTVHADFLAGGKEEVERIKGDIDIAAILGAPVLRHDATWSIPEGMSWREAIEKIKGPIREVTEYAASKGIRTCTENHGYVLQDSERVEELIRAVGHPNYGWLVDMGNFLCADELAIHAIPVAAPYAFHVHAKDFLVKPADADDPGEGWFKSRHGTYLRGTVVGHGVVPIRQSIETLRKAGYDGFVSLEFEGMEDNLTAIECGYAFLRKIVG